MERGAERDGKGVEERKGEIGGEGKGIERT